VKALGFLRENFLPVLHDEPTEDFNSPRRRAFALGHITTPFLSSHPLIRQIRRQMVAVNRHHPAEGEEQDRRVIKRAPAFLHLPAVFKLSKNRHTFPPHHPLREL